MRGKGTNRPLSSAQKGVFDDSVVSTSVNSGSASSDPSRSRPPLCTIKRRANASAVSVILSGLSSGSFTISTSDASESETDSPLHCSLWLASSSNAIDAAATLTGASSSDNDYAIENSLKQLAGSLEYNEDYWSEDGENTEIRERMDPAALWKLLSGPTDDVLSFWRRQVDRVDRLLSRSIESRLTVFANEAMALCSAEDLYKNLEKRANDSNS